MAALCLLQLRHLVSSLIANKALSLLLSSSIAIAASILVGVLSYHLFEAPFLRLKRFFAYGQ